MKVSKADAKRLAEMAGAKPDNLPRSKAAERRQWRSDWERQYAAYLDAERLAGRVSYWRYESIRLRIGVGAWYKPDFAVWLADGSTYMVDVKGLRREAAMVRIKAAAARYPMYSFAVVSLDGGQWTCETIIAEVADVI